MPTKKKPVQHKVEIEFNVDRRALDKFMAEMKSISDRFDKLVAKTVTVSVNPVPKKKR
jgi:hypothetical protein